MCNYRTSYMIHIVFTGEIKIGVGGYSCALGIRNIQNSLQLKLSKLPISLITLIKPIKIPTPAAALI